MASIQASTDGYENHFLLAIIEKLYLKSEKADVYFVFGDDNDCERIPAHKWLLAAGSDVFNAMFYGDLKEKGDVEIVDASADAFKEFLQFFYRSKVNLTVQNAFDVVNLGKKYDVAASQSICDRFLKDELTITSDNVCSVYGIGTYFDMDDVKKLCESKVVEDTEAVFGSSSFLDCDRSVLSSILKLDKLSCSEVSVFHACMNWVKAKAKQEEITREMVDTHLGDLFYEIPFGSITLEELADFTPLYGGLFSAKEFQEIIQMIRFEDFQSKMFKRNHRQVPVPCFKWNADPKEVILCCRTVSCGVGSSSFKNVEKTTFTTNKPILLGGIWCLAPNCNHLPVEMTIYETSDDGATKALYSDKNVIFTKKIALKKPILIIPGFQFEIQIKHSSAQQLEYYDCNLKDKVQLPGSDVIIEFIGENKTGGIIHSLEFNQFSKA